MKIVTINIDGAEQEINLNEILTINSPDSERAEVAVHLAWWGSIFGAKLEEEELADASYRQWHGQTICGLLESEEKAPAEWKVKAVVEADPGFMEAKQRIARAKRDVASAKAIFDAYSRKADILARLIARENTEAIRTGDVGRGDYTPAVAISTTTTAADPTKTAAKVDKVAAAIAATKAKKDATKK